MNDITLDPNLLEEKDSLNIAIVSGTVERNPYYNESRSKGKRQQYASFSLNCQKNLKDDDFDSIRIKAYGMNAIYIKENLFKDMEVVITGSVHSSYRNNEVGKKDWYLCIVAENIDIKDIEQPLIDENENYVPVVIPPEMIDEMPFK